MTSSASSWIGIRVVRLKCADMYARFETVVLSYTMYNWLKAKVLIDVM